jgi:glycosyltransferase involved in cell wall biosynthesis
MRDVSVIIRVKNDSWRLARAVASIRTTAPKSEVVIVDNMSTDNTYSVAQKIGDEVLQQHGALGTMRRPGVERSSRPIVFFVDADQVLLPGTVESAVSALTNAEAVLVPERPLYAAGLFNKTIAAERTWAELSGMGIPRVFWRTRYLGYSVPNGVLFGEDRIVGDQVRTIQASSIPILHDEPSGLRALLRKYRRYGELHDGTPNTVVSPSQAAIRYGAAIHRLPPGAMGMVPCVAALKAAKGIAFYTGAAQSRRSKQRRSG